LFRIDRARAVGAIRSMSDAFARPAHDTDLI
jgi:hypothetical protein